MTSTDEQPDLTRCPDCKQPIDARHLDGCPAQIEEDFVSMRWIRPLSVLDGMGNWTTPGSW